MFRLVRLNKQNEKKKKKEEAHTKMESNNIAISQSTPIAYLLEEQRERERDGDTFRFAFFINH